MIEIKNLTFGYGSTPLFSGLDLELMGGHVYGLLGRNGAGKSTLLKLIAGLLAPKSGTVTVGGVVSFERRVSTLDKIMLVPEEFKLPAITILEYASIYGGFYPRFSRAKFEKLLGEFGTPTAQPLDKMSFGQRKIAYLCFAIACSTEMLIMDEPTNGLDIPAKSTFRRVVSSALEPETTIIISTHQVRDLDQILDHVLILDNSQVLINASTSKITERLYFGRMESPDGAVYCESTIYGTMGVTPNTSSDTESPLDMELLFNATLVNPQQIKNLLR